MSITMMGMGMSLLNIMSEDTRTMVEEDIIMMRRGRNMSTDDIIREDILMINSRAEENKSSKSKSMELLNLEIKMLRLDQPALNLKSSNQ